MARITFCVIAVAVTAAACARAPSPDSSPAIHLDTADPQEAIVEVSGLSRRDLSALSELDLTTDEWSVVLRVAVKGGEAHPSADLPAVAGQYAVGDSIRFIPSFPLDAGREYDVSFDPSRVPRINLPRLTAARAVVSLPRVVHTPSTVVTAVYPSGDVILENQLRMYVQFSGPMGQQAGLDHIALLDKAGHELVDAMLPLDTELWNSERTRYTVILDPGRVKREILPNRMMGRPLRRGETITLVVKKDWLDGRGVPLKSEFRRDYRVGPAIERPLNTAEWRIATPPAGTRDALTITFPAPLDHALTHARSACRARGQPCRAICASRRGRLDACSCRAIPGRRGNIPSSCYRSWRTLQATALDGRSRCGRPAMSCRQRAASPVLFRFGSSGQFHTSTPAFRQVLGRL